MSTDRYDVATQKGNYVKDATLRYVSSAKYGGDWMSSPHSHQCTEVFYVVGGIGGFKIESDSFQVKEHDLVVVNPNVQHTEVSWNSAPLEYIVLGVDGLVLTSPDKQEDRYFLLNFEKQGDTVLTCLKMMLNEVENKLPGADSICQNLLQILIVQLMRETNISAEATEQATRRECVAAKWYIDAHFKEKIDLDLLAKLTGVNKYYLAHSFTKVYGISPIKYLYERKIQEAKYLLSSTDLPIGRIVQTLGFSKGSYFSKMFNDRVGMTPSAYRAKTHGKNEAPASDPSSG